MKISITIFIFLLQAISISALAVNEELIPSDTATKKNYSMFGLTFGYPGFINFIAGYHFDGFALIGELGPTGGQANFGIKLLNSKSFESNLSLGGGYIHFDTGGFLGTIDWSYLGVFIDLNAGEFFFECGFRLSSTGKKLYVFESDLYPLFQLGYVYRFNK